MKIVFSKKGLTDKAARDRVIVIPTTVKEKRFFSDCRDEEGRYRPSVYMNLLRYADNIIDNSYDVDGDEFCTYTNIIKDNKLNDREWKEDAYIAELPTPSNLCILSLYYFSKAKNRRKSRRLMCLYKRLIHLYQSQSLTHYLEKAAPKRAGRKCER